MQVNSPLCAGNKTGVGQGPNLMRWLSDTRTPFDGGSGGQPSFKYSTKWSVPSVFAANPSSMDATGRWALVCDKHFAGRRERSETNRGRKDSRLPDSCRNCSTLPRFWARRLGAQSPGEPVTTGRTFWGRNIGLELPLAAPHETIRHQGPPELIHSYPSQSVSQT